MARSAQLSPGCRSWLLLLASRSNDEAKPVWGAQVRMGEQMGRCERSVRYYRAEAEGAGFIVTKRADPCRDRATGRVYRPRSNAYLLTMQAQPTDPSANPDRSAIPNEPVDVAQETLANAAQAAARTTSPAAGQAPSPSSPHRPASPCRSTPLPGVRNPGRPCADGPGDAPTDGAEHEKDIDGEIEAAHGPPGGWETLKALLRPARRR